MEIQPVATFHSCYPEKFGVPRQSGLVAESTGDVVLVPPYNVAEALRGLAEFSHLWLVFGFHKCGESGWQPTVRPPRLGGNKRVGVFASRSPFRPNGLGLSVVRIVEVRANDGCIVVAGHDLVDGSPVYDIKPYLPYSDALEDADCGYAPPPESALAGRVVAYSVEATKKLEVMEQEFPGFQDLLESTLRQDPRPAYRSAHRLSGKCRYGLRIYDADIHWVVEARRILVEAITRSSR